MKIYRYLVVGESVKQAECCIKTFDEFFHDKCKAMSLATMRHTDPVPAIHIIFTDSFSERADVKDIKWARNYFSLCKRLAICYLEESD